jgi:integration host factor subunit alpha
MPRSTNDFSDDLSSTTSDASDASDAFEAEMYAHLGERLTVTKSDLANSLHEGLGLPKSEALQVIDVFFDIIQKALTRGEEVKLIHFGSFELREKKARPGRNPKTGEAVTITPRRVVTFHASPKLKQRMGTKQP